MMGTMVSFCHKVVGRGVVPLSHIKARLRDYQVCVSPCVCVCVCVW